MQIIRLSGKAPQLYSLLAPLVMDPVVIKANNNYPFKTGEKFTWFVACDKDAVKGFMPVEQKRKDKVVINNYYAEEGKDREKILYRLLEATLNAFPANEWELQSVTLAKDKETFEKFNFAPLEPQWKRYVKMYRK